MPMRGARHAWPGLALALGLVIAPLGAQTPRDAERRLEQTRRELGEVASERRRLEGARGEAAQDMRAADERVSAATATLHATQARIAREETALAALGERRRALDARLGGQREELAALLRAAYTLGDHAALKLLLAQDRVEDANRMLAYHRSLQAQRTARIHSLTQELSELDGVEREIQQRSADLAQARTRQQAQVAALERERAERAAQVAQLEAQVGDQRSREQQLGRDVRALEGTLSRLRAAAARAAEREAQARARAAQAPPARGSRAAQTPRRAPAQVARGAPLQVGGLSWPVSGSLLAGYGARMPDGRPSAGVLIAAPAGTPVTAVADGTVVFSEWMTGYGLIVIVDHGNDHMSLYAHNDALLRQVGDRVSRGDALASVGTSGGQGQAALYFELRRAGQPVDPGTWLRRR